MVLLQVITQKYLNNFFSSVFTDENLLDLPSLGNKYSGEPQSSVQVSPGSSWVDSICLNLLVLIATILVFFVRSGGSGGLLRPLFLMFRKSLEEGQLPAAWKEAIVTPI